MAHKASVILEKKLGSFIRELRSQYGRSDKIPATAIGAEHMELKAVGHSGKVPSPLAPKLERELVTIAPLGDKGIKFRVGCCCEVSASNQLILQRDSIPIRKIIFTAALRPRTYQTIRRCGNCKLTFG